MSGEEIATLLERALAYPYAIPKFSFVQRGEETLDPSEVEFELGARRPLLAYGSNASPGTLARKLGAASLQDPVPVMRAQLDDYDVVYSAHISIYGAIPATLQPSRGVQVTVSVAYLTEHQLALVSQSEPNYELVSSASIACRLEIGNSPDEVAFYSSRHGPLTVEGAQTALAAIPASGRRAPAMTQRQILERVRDRLSPDSPLEEFVLEGIRDPELAGRRTVALKTLS